ncbi:MAG: hypothetical protein KIT52_06865 [Anaerolineae bacterium]|nr:hypothetical protein [Anaerolineae bacterium]
MNKLDRERLSAVLKGLSGEYNEAVKELGRERQIEFGADFNLGDFIAGASAIYKLAVEENAPLPWPATSWVWALLAGLNPLWPGGGYEPDDPFRQQWLVIAVPKVVEDTSRVDTISSFNDEEEAVLFALTCDAYCPRRDGAHYDYLVVRVPVHGYEDRVKFADVWAKVEADEEE